MMTIPIFQVDAFTQKAFGGNPAAICLLNTWLADDVLQRIAAENNLSDTAYLVKTQHGYDLRWFTPEIEVDLCGHATLASAYVIFEFLQPELQSVSFSTASGVLTVTQNSSKLLSMNFPSRPAVPIVLDIKKLTEALGKEPVEVLQSRDLVAVYESEDDVLALQPNIEKLKAIEEGFLVIITAKGKNVDFVSRCFAPKGGIDEDPVTGSAHCTLIPFWSERLNKSRLTARQVSKRGGDLFCEYAGDRVVISGYAALFLRGEIFISS
jgi:PhzF family phenazine biosynthesis protein